ncbi:OmpL47-type beta-barrel domain-containing protein [Methanooceanicella nereidis]|nr:Ig-like domain-containing protein [Methanocella sp. CWC-04]
MRRILCWYLLLILILSAVQSSLAASPGVEDVHAVPSAFNSSGAGTTIDYTLDLAYEHPVMLEILGPFYNVVRNMGQGVQGSGFFSVMWDGRDDSNTLVPEGNYTVRVNASIDGYEYMFKWGCYGSSDGQFARPYGIAINDSGYVYVTEYSNNVAETENHRVQVFAPDGVFVTKWGGCGSNNGQFMYPLGIAINASGFVYVVDSKNYRVQVFDSNGNFITNWGSRGSGDGQFESPYGIAINSSGFVFVTDIFYNRVQVFDSNGNFVTKWGSFGITDGKFQAPCDIAINNSDYVSVIDSLNRVQVFDSNGIFMKKWGTTGSGDGQLQNMYCIEIDENDSNFITDSLNRVQIFDCNGNFITKFGLPGNGNGQLDVPYNIVLNSINNVYVADTFNSRIQAFSYFSNIYNDTSIIVDDTCPVTTTTISGTKGNNDWYTSDIGILLNAYDNGSGVKSTEYGFDGLNLTPYEPFTITDEGLSTFYYGSMDYAGNIEPARSQTIKIDKTLPEIAATLLSQANVNGWHNESVVVRFTASDSISGIDTITSDILISTEGSSQSATGTASDIAGNTNSFTVTGINIDRTPPSTICILNGSSGNNDRYLSDVQVTLAASDDLSGINITGYSLDGISWIESGTLNISSEGTTRIFYRSIDNAGNVETSNSISITIDRTSPSLLETYPVNNSIDVPVNAIVRLMFSESIDLSGTGDSTFLIYPDTNNSTAVTGNLSCSGYMLVFSPYSELEYDTEYTAHISDEIKDETGNCLAHGYILKFRTCKSQASGSVMSSANGYYRSEKQDHISTISSPVPSKVPEQIRDFIPVFTPIPPVTPSSGSGRGIDHLYPIASIVLLMGLAFMAYLLFRKK